MHAKSIVKGLYALCFGAILYFWLKSSLPLLLSPDMSSILLAIGRIAGLTSVFLVLTQLLLIGRIKWIETLWGHDKLAKLHRSTGELLLYSIIIHFVCILVSYAGSAKTGLITLLVTFFDFYQDVFEAFIAFVMFVAIALSSIFIKRLRLKYETWYFIHLFVYLAIFFSYGHQLKIGGSLSDSQFALFWMALYVFVIANFVVFRFLRPTYFFMTHKFFVSRVVKGTSDETMIYISGKNMQNFKRLAGQFMIFRFLDRKRFWQAHPFSLSWDTSHHDIRITVKDSGDFTHEISGIQVGTPVFIDGPHGRFVIPEGDTSKLLFIAGGIGITPIMSLLSEHAKNHDTVLLYSNKTQSAIPLKNEITEVSQKHGVKTIYFFTEETTVRAPHIAGRIDKMNINAQVKDVTKRVVYLCGPVGFMEAVKSALLELGVPEENIHYEVFSFH